jgi:hypothetical protein
MANEEAAGAVVKLDADTSPWERSMAKVAEQAKTWGKKIADNLATMNLMESMGRFESMKGQLESMSRMGMDGIGQKMGGGLGAGIGQAAGMAFAGPFGAQAGNLLGGVLGEQLGQSLGKGIGDGLKGDTWMRDIKLSAGRIGELFTVDWDKLWGQSLEDVWAGVQEKAGKAWEEVQTLGAKALFRLEQAVDGLWDKARKPFAAIANWTQEIGVKLGLVEEGTTKWGDALLMIQDMGQKVVGDLGYGLGYLEGLFIKLGGVITKHVVAPLTTGLGTALQATAVAIGALTNDPKIKLLLGAAGIDLGKITDGLSAAGRNLTTTGVQLGVGADVLANLDPNKQGELRRNQIVEGVKAGKAAVANDAPAAPAPAAPPPPPPQVFDLAKAVLADSREAANIRARVGVQDQQIKALDKVANQGEKQVEQQKDMIDILRDIGRQLFDAPVIKPG